MNGQRWTREDEIYMWIVALRDALRADEERQQR